MIRRNQEDKILLDDIPCMKCKSFKTALCKLSFCKEFAEYKKKQNLVDSVIWKKDDIDALDRAGKFASGNISNYTIEDTMRTPLAEATLESIPLGTLSKFVTESKIFKAKEKRKKKHFLTFLECTHIAKIS